MFQRVVTVVLTVLAVGVLSAQVAQKRDAAPNEFLSIYFSPNGGAAQAVVGEIEKATSTLDVAAYTITHPDISRALIHAHERGVKVRVILDPTLATANYSAATPLVNAGIPVSIERGSGLLHHKLAIIDGATVITGSMNWSRAGDESNSEDLVIIRDKQIASDYLDHYQKLLDRANPYERPVKNLSK